MEFPNDFLWGVATAAYQIEGAVTEDGRRPSIWDTYSHTPGMVRRGDTGDIACDHYHRWEEDLDLLADLGVDAYRFSVAWPRVQPDAGRGVNQRGLDFYRRLVDGLRDRGITPIATLYHWDLPDTLDWRDRDTAERFADYAEVMFEALGDRVPMWITLNEPYCSAFLGYAEGRHAPGLRLGHGALQAAHHLLLGHARAVQAFRARGLPDSQIGITLNFTPSEPYAAADRRAADLAYDLNVRWFSDPIFLGSYPKRLASFYRDITDFSFMREGDPATIQAPLDFLGVNYYAVDTITSHRVPEPSARTAADIGARRIRPDGVDATHHGKPIQPDGLRRLLLFLRDAYPSLPPIYITENGCAYHDYIDPEGHINDEERIAYLEAHLQSAAAARRAGVDLRGYFYWSLMDNFEWAEGYGQRYGLVFVDYATQRRTPKASYKWFRNVIRS